MKGITRLTLLGVAAGVLFLSCGGKETIVTTGPSTLDPADIVFEDAYEPDWGANDLILFTHHRTDVYGSWLASCDRHGDNYHVWYATSRVWAEGPAWSPDCSKVAYAAADEWGMSQVYVLDLAPGSEPVQVTEDGGGPPAWSPDGTRLAYCGVEMGDYNQGEVWVVTLATGEKTRLTDGVVTRNPTWTPDGRAVTYADDSAVYNVDLNGNAAKLFDVGNGGAFDPAWSPDGARLALTVRATDHYWQPGEIFVWDEATGKLEPFTRSFFDCDTPTWSPEGDAIAFGGFDSYSRYYRDIYVMAWPRPASE